MSRGLSAGQLLPTPATAPLRHGSRWAEQSQPHASWWQGHSQAIRTRRALKLVASTWTGLGFTWGGHRLPQHSPCWHHCPL